MCQNSEKVRLIGFRIIDELLESRDSLPLLRKECPSECRADAGLAVLVGVPLIFDFRQELPNVLSRFSG